MVVVESGEGEGRGCVADLGPRRKSGHCQRCSHCPRQGWKGGWPGWAGVCQLLPFIHPCLPLAQPNGRRVGTGTWKLGQSPQSERNREGVGLKASKQVSCSPVPAVSRPHESGVLRGLGGGEVTNAVFW